jgi:oxygen-independent coproporphyrinogen III oxidase
MKFKTLQPKAGCKMTFCVENPLDLWMSKPAPRYTSYPPAPFFHAGAGAADYAASLARLKPGEPVSLYLHIPFCAELCLFCGCHTYITRREDRLAAYLRALVSEMELAARATHRLSLSHLHLGGGTPNAISAAGMDYLFGALRRIFDFSNCREIAMEVDPRTLNRDQVKAMAAGGVTRASLGVQDFNPQVQKLVNRMQPYHRVAEVCGWLHAGGIGRINFDLMYGLPAQTPGSVAAVARQAAGLDPDRFALFSYAHVPQVKPHQKALSGCGIPDGTERLRMERAARDALTGAGYAEIGMDHFAKPDDSLARAMRERRMRRNFQGYTDDEALTTIAFGASAIGQTPDGFFQNEKAARPYQTAVSDGRLPIVRGYLLTPEDRVRSAIIEQLMCYFDCNVEAVSQRHQWAAERFAPELEAMRDYEDAGLVARDGYKISLTSPYRMAIRSVAFLFDAHSSRSNELYSKVA